MRANAIASTCKSSKQTQHASASLFGCGGLVNDDPMEEEDDFEVELDAVDVVSFALAVVSLGSKVLVSDSIRGNGAPIMRGRRFFFNLFSSSFLEGGICRVPVVTWILISTNY